MDQIVTADNHHVGVGDRVFNYYDGWWGVIRTIDDDGWCVVERIERGGGAKSLNGERLSVARPSWSV